MKTLVDRFDLLHYTKVCSTGFTDVARALLRNAVVAAMLVIPISLLGQELIVTGRITDEVGEGIPGVNVVVKGTTNGTATDLEGRYTIRFGSDPESTLVISSIGNKTVEEQVGRRSVIDVQLAGDFTQLGEIVVTGYSTLMKKDVASSISVVDVEDMKKIAASNFADQLQGKVAGVQVSTSGDPGSLQYVRIRGIGTINNNEPLYVIDGVPVQNETDMNFLNPNDIESMQVLKDAAAASIYGARAANGVVVITTKRGKGRSKINVDFFTGFQDPQKFPEMANPSELLEIQRGLSAGSGAPFSSTFYIESPKGSGQWILPDYLVKTTGYTADEIDLSDYVLNTSEPDQFGRNYPIASANVDGTDWFNELFKPAPLTSVQLSASGGNEKGSHYFSINYFDYKGILIENEWKRVQTRLNSTFTAGKNFRLGENINVSFQTGKGIDGPRFNVENAYRYLPIVPVYDIDGYWAAAAQSGQPFPNPVANQTRNAAGINYNNLRLTGNVFAELDLFESLTFKVNAGLDYFQEPTERYFYPCPECANPGTNALEKVWANNRNWVVTSTLNFTRNIGDHDIYSVIGAEARSAYGEGLRAAGSNLKYGDDPYYRELSNAASGTYSIDSYTTESKMLSAFANVNYTFRDRYIVSATLRTDGSSKFINNTYGLFPGFSAAWRISEESFLLPVNFISDLKLRASYGITGNNEVVGGDYPGYSSYGTEPYFSTYSINGSHNQFVQGFAQVSSGNPNLKWETSKVTNIALDAMLNNGIDFTVEWYDRRTDNMILGMRLPMETGNPFPMNTNIGSMVNKGIDLQFSYKGEALSGNLNYSIGITGSHYTNKVLGLAPGTTFIAGAALHGGYPSVLRTQPGYPVSQYFGLVAEGLWSSQEEIETILFDDPNNVSGAKVGRMKFRDVNGDGRITSNDRTFIGSPIPDFTLGLNLTMNYRNFDFTAFFSGAFGAEVFNAVRSYTDFNDTNVLLSFSNNHSKRMLYEAGKSLPVLDLNDTYSGNASSYFVEDASFLRFRNAVLGYTFPLTMASKAGLSKVRLYVQAQNLFTITNYSGLDPDITILNYQTNQSRRDLSTGLDVGRYPLSRQFIVGLNIEF